MKKAMIETIFVLVAVCVVVGLVIIMGYGFYNSFMSKAQEASYLEFQKQFKQDLALISSKAGNSVEKSYSIKGFDSMCMADLDYRESILANNRTNGLENLSLVMDALSSNTSDNIFLIGKDEKAFTTTRIGVPGNFTCISLTNERFSVLLEGKGRKSLITIR